jgi:hypothetical protein
MYNLIKWIIVFGLVFGIGISVLVQMEVDEPIRTGGNRGGYHAVIVHQPNVIDDFIGEMTGAVGKKLQESGWKVTYMTAREDHDLGQFKDVKLVIIGTNTYYWHPDLPTMNFIKINDENLKDQNVVVLVGGFGDTRRAEKKMKDIMSKIKANLLAIKSLWIQRPNDEKRMDEDNREVAKDIAVKTVFNLLEFPDKSSETSQEEVVDPIEKQLEEVVQDEELQM